MGFELHFQKQCLVYSCQHPSRQQGYDMGDFVQMFMI